MSQVISLTVGPDHPVPVEPSSTQTATVTVSSSGSTVFYADNRQVSTTVNQGSIALSGSATFSSPVWLTSASYTSVSVNYQDLGPQFLSGVTIGEGGNSQHTAIFTPRSAVLPEPVMTLQPVVANLVCALDVAPSSGATAQNQNGFAWIDICDGPVQSLVTYIGTSTRLGNGGIVTSLGSITVSDLSTRKFGGATARPLTITADWNGSADPQIYMVPSSNANPAIILGANGNDVIVSTSSLNTSLVATNATKGFFFIPTTAGAPTGTPANTRTNTTAMIYDSTNSKIWFYQGGTWKGVVVA